MNVLKRNKTEKFHYTLVNKETMQNEYYCDTTKVEYEIVNLEALDINNASISFHISKDGNSCYVNCYDSCGWYLRLESYELNKVDDKLFLTGIIEMKYKSYICPVCGEEMHYLCSYSNTA